MSETTPPEEDEEVAEDHLSDVDDGCGCAEIWEYLSEHRESASD